MFGGLKPTEAVLISWIWGGRWNCRRAEKPDYKAKKCNRSKQKKKRGKV